MKVNECLDFFAHLSQHGESEHNLKGLIGGDADLSVRGKLYAEALANYIKQQNIEGLRVWTSWMKRLVRLHHVN